MEHTTTGLTNIGGVMVGPDGDADDVLVAGAEDQGNQQEEQEQGTRAPASDRLQGVKIYGRKGISCKVSEFKSVGDQLGAMVSSGRRSAFEKERHLLAMLPPPHPLLPGCKLHILQIEAPASLHTLRAESAINPFTARSQLRHLIDFSRPHFI